jgi:hypothetical protein
MKFIVELLFLVYGLFLLQQAQYLTLLILLVLSFILVLKGFKYNHGVIISISILLFLTQFHRYYPYRDTSYNYLENFDIEEEDDNNDNNKNENNMIEGFKVDKEIIKMKKEARKKRKERKKVEKRLKEEYTKATSNMPRRYLKNKKKIDKKTDTWGDGLKKWKYLKENFYIILNM